MLKHGYMHFVIPPCHSLMNSNTIVRYEGGVRAVCHLLLLSLITQTSLAQSEVLEGVESSSYSYNTLPYLRLSDH